MIDRSDQSLFLLTGDSMPVKSKTKKASKTKTISKVKTISKSKIKVDTSDPVYQELKAKKRHQLRNIAEKYGVSPYAGSQAQLRNNIYRAMKEKVIVKKTKNIDKVTVENTVDGSLVTVGNVQKDYNFIVSDKRSTPVKEVRADSSAGLLEIETIDAAGNKLATIVQVNPALEKQAEELDKLEPERSSKYKKLAIRQKHLVIKDNQLYPNYDTRIIPAKWSKEKKKEQVEILKDYERRNIVPFMFPFGARDYVGYQQLKDSLPVVDIVSEKPLSELEKIGKKRFPSKSVHSTAGNNIQTQIFSVKQGGDKTGKWVGFYTQPKGKPKARKGKDKFGNPVPTLAVPREFIMVDDDNAGHYIAYTVNMYAFGKPYKQNVLFTGSSEKDPVKPKKVKVNRFIAKSITDSLALRQNDALVDAVQLNLGKKALLYRREGEPTQLNLSEQLLQITREVHRTMLSTNIQVKTIDGKFEFENVNVEAFNEGKPVLYFKPDPITSKKVRRLDSDTMLRIAVRKFQIEPDSAQAILESLHNQGWISYPRAGVEKAREEPIELLRPVDRKVNGKWNADAGFNRKFSSMLKKSSHDERRELEKGFSGTTQEREILELVKQAEIAFIKQENFIQDGDWILESGDRILRTEGDLIAGEPDKYTDDIFDVIVTARGITPLKLTNYLTKKNIGTPATRTSEMSKLKSAGILTLKDDRYILDKKGLYLVATLRVIEEEDVPTALELQEQIREATKIAEFEKIVNDYVLLDREYLAKRIKEEAESLVEAEADLSFLDSF